MIDLILDDAVTKLKTISALNNRVGMALGGRDIDPQLENVPKPAAWILYNGSTNIDEREDGSCVTPVRHDLDVLLIVDNGNATHLKTNVFPLIESVIAEINGKEGPLGTKYYRYESSFLDALESDRLIYSFRFTIIAMI